MKKVQIRINNLHLYLLSRYNLNYLQYTLKDFVRTNSHLGYEVKRWNPNMRPYIWGIRNGMHVLNLNLTILAFKRVLFLLPILIKLRKSILFVSENKQIDHVLRKVILKSKQHICSNRWIGGVLTNFKIIQALIFYLNYSKVRKLYLSRKQKKLKAALSGILKLFRFPTLVIVLNAVKSKWAVNEVRAFKLLCVNIVDSSTSNISSFAPFIIPGNVYGFAAQVFYIKIFQNCILNARVRERLFFTSFRRKSALLTRLTGLKGNKAVPTGSVIKKKVSVF